MSDKKIILTGDRPTGKLHIGHYFGSLQNRVKLQDEYEEYIMIADTQALTDNFNNPDKVRNSVRELCIDYLSCGIDPKKTTIFIQSMIPELPELTVYYSNLVTVARLERNPTVKTEIAQKKELFGNDGESITYGFLGYPVSQSADITAFGAHLVPVGEDQLPMIEQTREIVRKFNNIYGETLVEIYISDSEEEITKKVMGAVTDTTKIRKDDPADPEKCMVGYYHKMFSGDDTKCVFSECREGKRGCVACKRELAHNICEYLKPMREKRRYYEENPEIIDKVLKDGVNKARMRSKETLKKVKKAMKIDYFE